MNYSAKKDYMLEIANENKSLYKNPKLRFLFFELTDKCNLKCMHCGSNCYASNNLFLDIDLIEKTLLSVAKECNPSEIMVCLTGGEPLLHPDVYRVISLARLIGFSVGMTSNGTFIGTQQAEMLVKSGLNTITVSIDGVGSIHDRFRGVEGSFDRAINGIRCLKNAGIEPQALTVVHMNNINHLEDIYEFLKSEGICSWRLVLMEPIGRANSNESLILKKKGIRYLLNYIKNKRLDNDGTMEVTYGCSHFLSYEFENEVRDYFFQCNAGIMTASVMANGDIGACLDIDRNERTIQGNINEDDFMDVWKNKFEVFRRNRAESSELCKECGYKEACLGDSAHTWDFEKDAPYYCVTKLSPLTVKKEERFIENTKDKCGKCFSKLGANDKFCKFCGTAKGEGNFIFTQDQMYCVYGPPITELYKCKKCKYVWKSTSLGSGGSNFCPQCGSEKINGKRQKLDDMWISDDF